MTDKINIKESILTPAFSEKLTPQEKSNYGLPLSAEDIKQLMKDPNSWVRKTFDQQVQSALLEEAYKKYLIEIMQEFQRKEERREDEELRESLRDEKQQQQTVNTQQTPLFVDSIAPAISIQVELKALLSLSPENMTASQLAKQSQKLISNYHKQVAAMISASPTTTATLVNTHGKPVTLAITIPPNLALPTTGATLSKDILKFVSSLSPDEQEGFAINFTNRQLGANTVIGFTSEKHLKAILQCNKDNSIANDIEIDSSENIAAIKKASIAFFDKTTMACKNENQEMENVCLNNFLAQIRNSTWTLKHVKVEELRVSQPPAFFSEHFPTAGTSPKPQGPRPGNKKLKNDEDEIIRLLQNK